MSAFAGFAVLSPHFFAGPQHSLGSVATKVVSCAPCPVVVIAAGAQNASDLNGKAA